MKIPTLGCALILALGSPSSSAFAQERQVPVAAPAPIEFVMNGSEPRWTLDLDTIVGRSTLDRGETAQSGTVASFLATIRYRPSARLSFGAVVPFVLGRESYRCGGGEGCPQPPVYAGLGQLALFGSWERPIGPTTRLPFRLLIAFPSALGTEEGVFAPEALGSHAWFAVNTRGLEDGEFFHPGFLAIVPSVELSHHFNRVDLSGSLKLPLLIKVVRDLNNAYGKYTSVVFDVVVTGKVMVRVLERPTSVISGGVQLVGVGMRWWPATDLSSAFSVALEPRVEARLGALQLRAGFVIPLAFPLDEPQFQYTEVAHFPEAWGVRIGVGYSF